MCGFITIQLTSLHLLRQRQHHNGSHTPPPGKESTSKFAELNCSIVECLCPCAGSGFTEVPSFGPNCPCILSFFYSKQTV